MGESVKVLVVRQSEAEAAIAAWIEENQDSVAEVIGSETSVVKDHDADDPTVSVTIRYRPA
ncbi:MAG: hypothetical protein ACYTGX_15490 [Planctomycetota bacterium]|jgi:hypothetical protein